MYTRNVWPVALCTIGSNLDSNLAHIQKAYVRRVPSYANHMYTPS